MKSIIALVTASLLATAAASRAGEGYPKFSWDHVPVYAHCSYEPEYFTAERFDFMAQHFNFITFAAGVKSNAETACARAAAEIKKRNPAAKVLFYFPGDGPHSPFTLSNASFPADGFLKESSVKRVANPKTGKVSVQEKPHWDKSREDVREWWSTVAGKAVTEYGCDGVFADGWAATVATRSLPKSARRSMTGF